MTTVKGSYYGIFWTVTVLYRMPFFSKFWESFQLRNGVRAESDDMTNNAVRLCALLLCLSASAVVCLHLKNNVNEHANNTSSELTRMHLVIHVSVIFGIYFSRKAL